LFFFSGAIISAADTNLMAGWFRFAGSWKLIESHRAIAVSSASILLSIPAVLHKKPRQGVGTGLVSVSNHQHCSIAASAPMIHTDWAGWPGGSPAGQCCARAKPPNADRIAARHQAVAVMLMS
jgi:hypothetical protein